MLPKKSPKFKDTRQTVSVPFAMGANLLKKVSNFSRKTEKRKKTNSAIGAPTHPLVTVFTKRPVTRGGRRPGVWYKHIWALLCRKQATKNLDPSPMAKDIDLFSGLGEESGTSRAISRPLDHGSTWYIRGRHLHSLALPDTKRVGRGLSLCRNRRPIIAWTVFWSACWQFSTWTHKFRRVQPREQIMYLVWKTSIFFCFLHT